MFDGFFNRNYIKFLFIVGWLILLCSLWLDLYFTNNIGFFPRSGAILCVAALLAEFRLAKMDRGFLIKDLKSALQHAAFIETGLYQETKYDKLVKLFAHVSLVAGTVVWAYGDLLT